ncbi:hypothetical protein FB567DRAFT_586494 [Paraphoma chrysanthemicola]|uniref:Uncharacterized protein n=1 Tax=Paraphoma chrysanthemicola TaxID=798071 RepID=A0A8K0W400_9PLEO|nr:hypothetical protein FB567DRAFT_586494 [Paraphoma chrysanthemicola]
MGLRKRASVFFGSKPPNNVPSVPNLMPQRGNGPPPVPALPTAPPVSALRIAAPPQRHVQKVQKPAIQVTRVTNENIRELRELIRYRYALDCKIWSVGKKVKWYQRDTVEADMRRADAALAKIRNTLDGWDRQEFFETMEQYKRFKEIKNRIENAQARNWEQNPPWIKEEVEVHNGVHEKDGRAIHYARRVSTAQGYANDYRASTGRHYPHGH